MTIAAVLKKLTMVTAGAVWLTSFVANANAASLVIPSLDVPANAVYTPATPPITLRSAPSFTVSGNFLPSDTLNLTTEGTINIAPSTPDGYIINAAGVAVSPTFAGQQPGEALPISAVLPASGSTIPLGALVIGNTSLGFFQLFSTSPVNGLGSSSPPTTLSLSNVPLSSIFTNSDFSGLNNGTQLELRITDVDLPGFPTIISIGSFRVSSPVPEPNSTSGLLAFGIIGAAAILRRKQLLPFPAKNSS